MDGQIDNNLTNWQTNRQINYKTDGQTEKWENILINRQTDK